MSFQIVFWSIAAVAVLIVLPIVRIWGIVDHLRTRASERPGSGGISAGIGAAMLEINRLVARPSVEHQIDAEHATLAREDDSGTG